MSKQNLNNYAILVDLMIVQKGRNIHYICLVCV